jgi:type IV pilus assembly protein PilB
MGEPSIPSQEPPIAATDSSLSGGRLRGVAINVIEVIDDMFKSAVDMNASDIHIEPKVDCVSIRFRVDGKFVPFKRLDSSIKQQLITRMKILSGLKIDENRLPQDGKATFPTQNQNIDMRVSILPVVFGEKVVIRILKKDQQRLSLKDIGLLGNALEKVEKALHKTYGIILATGPTGSGKSTTLYSVLGTFNPEEVNISTLEDPVEYTMPGVNQSQINADIGFDFPDGLRSLLRQDPDIIMVGEIRDRKTAQLAVESALTGHLVFSTLHTNDAATTVQRLVDMGVEPFLISSSVQVIVAQRLVRRVCPYCRVPIKLEGNAKMAVVQEIGSLVDKDIDQIAFFKAKGCDRCKNLGYKGRVGIYEVLEISPAIQTLILKEGIDSTTIKNQAIKEGMLTLLQDGLIKAALGMTTLEEVYRVVGN